MRLLIIITVLALLVLGGGGIYFYFRGGESGQDEAGLRMTKVSRGTLIQEVSLTGIVKPAEKVDLSFDRGGKIGQVLAQVGAGVQSGQVLVTLSNADLAAEVKKAEADLASEEARLAELKRGARPEDLRVSDVKVENAERSLEDSRQNLLTKLHDSYTRSDDAVRNRLDQFISSPTSANPQIAIQTASPVLEQSIETNRVLAESRLKSWNTSLAGLTTSSDFTQALDQADGYLVFFRALLRDAALLLDGLTPSAALTQTTIDTYRSEVGAGRTGIETAIANLTAAEEKWRSAISALNLAEEERTRLRAGSTAEEIAAQAAVVKRAEAQVQRMKADLNKTILHSPISGLVTRQEARVGESVSAGQILTSIIGTHFKIESNIPEADIAKIQVLNEAKVTLDAYGPDAEFAARVAKIDPGETIIEGVATYKGTLEFIKDDRRIKSGMTANIDIVTVKKDGVIMIPQRVVIRRGQDRLVQISKPGREPEERKIKTGVLGSDGMIEVISGLLEGETVLLP